MIEEQPTEFPHADDASEVALRSQLEQARQRHRATLRELRRATTSTELIRKLYRLEYMQLPVDELAAVFLDLLKASLGVDKVGLFRRLPGRRGFTELASRGYPPYAGVLLTEEEAEQDFKFVTPDDEVTRFVAEIRELADADQFAWTYNRHYGLALLIANAAESSSFSWDFSEADRPMTEVALEVFASVVQRNRVEQRLAYEALHDSLTGLPNRRMLGKHLQRIVQQKGGADDCFALLFVDIDRFKLINDSLGHVAGDDLLAAVGQRLRLCTRPGDLVSRLSGDEFAVLARDLPTAAEAQTMAERIGAAFRRPFEVNQQSIYVSASIGIAEGPAEYASGAELLRDADIAMYNAKRSGGGQFRMFGGAMHTDIVERLQLEMQLREALGSGQLVMHYQPIFDLRDMSVASFEALLRWQHPQRGLLSPGTWVEMMEASELAVDVGRWVLNQVAMDADQWSMATRGGEPPKLCVNISERQFTATNFVSDITSALASNGLDAKRLQVELTERMLLDCEEVGSDALEQLRKLGVQVVVDDFGTGYSSLSRLQKLPIDAIKIDRSFINELSIDAGHEAIVRTIVALARNLGMQIVAEGTETDSQLHTLKKLGCDYVQGYLLGRPMAANDAGAFFAESLRSKAAATT